MTNVTHGMNVEEVRRLGDDLARYADQLEQLATRLEREVANARWSGPNAERFKHVWWPKHRSTLRSTASALRGFGDSAKNNANEQADASNAGAGGSSASGGGGGSNDSVHPVGGDIWKYSWRLAQDAPLIGTAIGIGKIGWHGAMFSKSNLDEAIARTRYGGRDPRTLAAEANTMRESRAILKETIDTGVGLTPIGKYHDALDAADATGEYLLGTGDHSDYLSAGQWGTQWMEGIR